MSFTVYLLDIVRDILLIVHNPVMASGGPPSAAVRSTGDHRMEHATSLVLPDSLGRF
jgi:hypothetical protein